jgi:hypothetical protein
MRPVSILRPNGRLCDRFSILEMKIVFKRELYIPLTHTSQLALFRQLPVSFDCGIRIRLEIED